MAAKLKSQMVISGLVLENPNGMPVTPPYEGDHLAGIPGWEMLIDPDVAVPGGTRNIIGGGHLIPEITPWNAGDYDTLPGGQTMFNVQGTTQALPSDFSVNPTAWSAFFVVNSLPSDPVGGDELMYPVDALTTGFSPRITIRADGSFAVLTTNTTIRAQGGYVHDGVTRLLMATFSVADGIRIFYNGVLVDYEPTKTEPLDEHYLAGQFTVLHQNRGIGPLLVGVSGVLDIDLGSVRYASYRVAIERHLMTKYGLS